jgi:hypothetical protein
MTESGYSSQSCLRKRAQGSLLLVPAFIAAVAAIVSGVCGMANELNSTSQMVSIRKANRRFICDGLDAGHLCPNKSIH